MKKNTMSNSMRFDSHIENMQIMPPRRWLLYFNRIIAVIECLGYLVCLTLIVVFLLCKMRRFKIN